MADDIKQAEEIKEIREDLLHVEEELLEKLKQQATVHRKIASEELTKKAKNQEYDKEILENAQTKLKTLKEQIKVLETQIGLLNEINEHVESIAKRFTGITKSAFNKSFIGAIVNAKKEFGGLGKVLTEVRFSIKETFAVSNILVGTLNKITEASTWLVVQQEEAISSFRKATGIMDKYEDTIVDLELRHRQMGLTSQEVSDSLVALTRTSRFSQIASKEHQQQTALLTATLSKLGVATETTAAIQEEAAMVYGMTTQQSLDLQRELIGVAEALEMPVSMVQEGFKDAMPSLAKFGKQAPTIFKKTATAAKALGIEMGRLIDYTEQFQTFEGAAESAGKLNAVLGGPFVDDLELLNASFEGPTETLKVMRQGFRDSGKDIRNMGPAMQKFLARTAGFKDASEFVRAMTNDIDKFSGAANAGAKSQEELNKMLQEAQTVMDKLKNVGKAFAVSMRWFVDAVSWIATALVGTEGAVRGFVGAVGTAIGAGLMLNFVFGKTREAIEGYKAVKVALTGATAANAAVTEAAGNAAVKGAVQQQVANKVNVVAGNVAAVSGRKMMAFAFAVLAVGAGVGLAAAGVGYLVSSFKGLGDMAPYALGGIVLFFGGLTIMMAIMAKLSPAIALLSVGMGTMAVVMLAVGAAAMMIGTGISMAVKSVTKLVTALKGVNVDVLKEIGGAFKDISKLGSKSFSTDSGVAEFRRTINAVVKLESAVGVANTRAVVKEIMKLKSVSAEPATRQQQSKPVEITINLDGERIYNKVHKEVKDRLNITTYTR